MNPGAHLPLVESFYSIQGEGHFQGSAMYFIRLAGCNVGCVWCDTKESWNTDQNPIVSIVDIVKKLKSFPSKRVVITGGEPCMHNLTRLTNILHQDNFLIHIETSGVYPLFGNVDWICFSPKKFRKPLEKFYSIANEMKVIIYHKSDFSWAEEQAANVDNKDCLFFLQPEWSKQNKMIPLITEYVKNHPHWKISLQTHKFMNIS